MIFFVKIRSNYWQKMQSLHRQKRTWHAGTTPKYMGRWNVVPRTFTTIHAANDATLNLDTAKRNMESGIDTSSYQRWTWVKEVYPIWTLPLWDVNHDEGTDTYRAERRPRSSLLKSMVGTLEALPMKCLCSLPGYHYAVLVDRATAIIAYPVTLFILLRIRGWVFFLLFGWEGRIGVAGGMACGLLKLAAAHALRKGVSRAVLGPVLMKRIWNCFHGPDVHSVMRKSIYRWYKSRERVISSSQAVIIKLDIRNITLNTTTISQPSEAPDVRIPFQWSLL